MTLRTLLSTLMVSATVLVAGAADEAPIVVHITEIEGNTVDQPEKLSRLLTPVPGTAEAEADDADKEKTDTETPAAKGPYKGAGYRVQVFSDGNQRTAKAEAQRKASEVSRRFPNLRTYPSYAAPYWRLRVGDFRTRKEAEEAAAELRTAFPAQRHEIRVVRDRVTIRE